MSFIYKAVFGWLVVLFVAGISSCQKDKPNYPVSYESVSVREGECRVFTKDGELTSPALKEGIVNRSSNFLPWLEYLDVTGRIRATYLSSRAVELTIDQVTEEKNREVRQIDGLIYWESPDSALVEHDPFFPGSFSGFLAYRPIYYREFPVPGASGFELAAMAKDCYYAKKEGDKILFPMMDLFLKWGNEPGECRVVIGINNAWKEDGYSAIMGTDTLLVRQYDIVLEAQPTDFR